MILKLNHLCLLLEFLYIFKIKMLINLYGFKNNFFRRLSFINQEDHTFFIRVVVYHLFNYQFETQFYYNKSVLLFLSTYYTEIYYLLSIVSAL